jgi:L-2-hydroxyglutarate oxidase LhgO
MNIDENKCEITIVGGGIIGLAIGAELSRLGKEVIVLESEYKTMQHASSHNSEVIHSGLYYKPGSLKAELCVEGNNLLYDYCNKNQIDYINSGKLVVATNADEISIIESLKENGEMNGLSGLKILGSNKLMSLEPSLIAKNALQIKSTGIIDTHAYSLCLEAEIENNDNHIITSSKVMNGQHTGKHWRLEIGDENPYIINSDIVINASGYNSVELAKKLGLTGLPDMTYIKGHYYKYHGKNPFKHLIYPVPEKHGLGVHTSSDIQNSLRFGPDAEVVKEPNYFFESSKKRRSKFIESISKYFNGFDSNLLVDDFCGIRARIGKSHKESDFSILTKDDHGIEGLVNIAGIESPGLTSSLSIAKYVSRRL